MSYTKDSFNILYPSGYNEPCPHILEVDSMLMFIKYARYACPAYPFICADGMLLGTNNEFRFFAERNDRIVRDSISSPVFEDSIVDLQFQLTRLQEIAQEYVLLSQITVMVHLLDFKRHCFFRLENMSAFTTSVVALCSAWFEQIHLVKPISSMDTSCYLSCTCLREDFDRNRWIDFLLEVCRRYLVLPTEFWADLVLTSNSIQTNLNKGVINDEELNVHNEAIKSLFEAVMFLPSLIPTVSVSRLLNGHFISSLQQFYAKY